MEYRPLGRTGLNVSQICLGTMTWGQQNTEADGHAQMDYALDQGINFFDTAELYSIPPRAETQGSTERIIGSWFKARGSRDKVILASKVIGRSDNTWFRDDGSKGELSRAQIEEAVTRASSGSRPTISTSTRSTGPTARCPGARTRRSIRHQEGDPTPSRRRSNHDDLVKAGKIRHIGLSNESAWGTMTFLKHAEPAACPGCSRSRTPTTSSTAPTRRRSPRYRCAKRWACSPIRRWRKAILTGKYLERRPAGRARAPPCSTAASATRTPGAEPAIRKYVALAKEFGLDPAQMALAFVNSRPFVDVEHHRRHLDGAAEGGHRLHRRDDHARAGEAHRRVHLVHTNPCP